MSALTGDWRDGLAKTGDGTVRKILFNAAVGLRDHPAVAGQIAFNEFVGAAWIRGPLPWDQRPNRPWSEFDDIKATEWMQSAGVLVGSSIVREAVQAVAYEQRFHPVLDWIEKICWDGKERLTNWLSVYLGVPDTPLARACGRKFLVSAVARVQRPGCKCDHLIVLEGKQGLLKSTAVRTLVGNDEWFADQIADLGISKDSSQDLNGKWVIEISELAAIRPGEVEKVKSYISRQTDHYRASYGRRSGDVKRQTVFIGSTNTTEYLADSTGNRRFWPFLCTKIDVDAIARDRDQLWSEALAAFHAGETWWIDDAELRLAAEAEQEQRRVEDPWESVVAGRLHNPQHAPDRDGIRMPLELGGRVTVGQILQNAICKPIERQSAADQMRVGRILKARGWEKKKTKTHNVWLEPEVDTSKDPKDSKNHTESPDNARKGVHPGKVSTEGVHPETQGNGHA